MHNKIISGKIGACAKRVVEYRNVLLSTTGIKSDM